MSDEDYNCTSTRTLFYLPHCDLSTNEAVISKLLSTASLDNAILLGNDLRNYRNKILTDAQFSTLAPSVFKVVHGLLGEFNLDGNMEWRNLEPKTGEEYWDAFSDLCLMQVTLIPKEIIQVR